jgi:hypothetical protein
LKIFISWSTGVLGTEPKAEVSAYQILEFQDIIMVNAFKISSCFGLHLGLGEGFGFQPVSPFDPSVFPQQELADTSDQASESALE